MKERVVWIDIARFLGIFCIYLGHFHSAAGFAYQFVFQFHVPLFFFLSGCTERIGKEVSWKEYLIKTVKGLLIPFYLFSLLSLAIRCVETNSVDEVINGLLCIAKGNIRNFYFAEGLWFLSCLCLMKVAFYALRKLFKNTLVVFLICAASFWAAGEFLIMKYLWFNVDWMLYYIVFFAAGYAIFPWLQKFLSCDSRLKKIFAIPTALLSFAYTVVLFFGRNVLYDVNPIGFLSPLNVFLTSALVIYAVIWVAKGIGNVSLLQTLGENTLYLCGSEYMIKTTMKACIELLGLQLSFPHPLVTYIYAFLLLCAANYTFVPFEKRCMKFMNTRAQALSET